jgi:tRNA uridine 5-carboxymethylaminomethyl modification enzyme
MPVIEEFCDVVVVGAGHAGCEAALACARLGLETYIFTVSVESIALMPCNPNVGGSSKGHLVRELDALGGEMGKNIDKTFIQSKMLNKSKGPAVHSLRAQADKSDYSLSMRKVLENQEHLTIRQQEVAEIITEDVTDNSNNGNIYKKIAGVKTVSGAIYHAKAVVLCTGVYLTARCIYGDVSQYTGPNGLMAANHLSDSLRANGIELRRFKTGTPARIDKRSIDFSKMVEQKGDDRVVPFSFSTNPEDVQIDQVSCWLTYTNEDTHKVIRENIDRSPLYGGVIKSTGPRYCPSIEDKVMKFPDKDRHQVFIEPECRYTNEMYIDGMSSSMPEDVQFAMYRSVPGLENARIVRNAYAIEYDCIAPKQLKSTLEFKKISGLFSGGQFNGSSGYEEAAAQGLIAGINAAQYIKKKEQLTLLRSESYIGVLIDDLVTKENFEPYRMMTSRAEYRLLLRQDNADLRLTDIGHEVGLIDDERYDRFCKKREIIESEIERLKSTYVGANKKLQEFLDSRGSMPIATRVTLADILKRPEMSYNDVVRLGELAEEVYGKQDETAEENVKTVYAEEAAEAAGLDKAEITRQIEIQIKYEGYIERQNAQVEHFKKLEEKKIPENIDYSDVKNLRIEARQKLDRIRPRSIGQASRISGVSPADISMLLIYLKM